MGRECQSYTRKGVDSMNDKENSKIDTTFRRSSLKNIKSKIERKKRNERNRSPIEISLNYAPNETVKIRASIAKNGFDVYSEIERVENKIVAAKQLMEINPEEAKRQSYKRLLNAGIIDETGELSERYR